MGRTFDTILEAAGRPPLVRLNAVAELDRLGLGPESLEQKCLRQGSTTVPDGMTLKEETDRWLEAISATIGAPDRVPLRVLRRERAA